MQKGVGIKIIGKVQGVFFRNSSRIKARELGLFGWVRNDMGGTVSILAEGEDTDLRSFIEWCKYGSSDASVEKVDVVWHEYTGEFDDFQIK